MHLDEKRLILLALFTPILFAGIEVGAQTVKATNQAILTDKNIQVDNKITRAEKEHFNQVAQQSDQYTPKQAEVLNKIPGVDITADDLKERDKKGFPLNPVAWIFKPVIRLQEQSVKLEQQIMKLTGPIAALQPGMLHLEGRMTSMQGQLASLEEDTSGVQSQLVSIQKDIAAMHATLNEIKKPVTDLKGPIMSLRDPIMRIQEPITGVDKDLTDVKTLLSLVLTSIYAAAAIIAIGTPLAAILVWRNRQKLLPKPTEKQLLEEKKLAETTKVMDQQIRRG